jgi:AcrR family transcriptional regulator
LSIIQIYSGLSTRLLLRFFYFSRMPTRQSPASLKPPENLRRQPTQARAQQTIQTLFKAAAQILDRDGEAGLSTNKVAASAGFSIGTLYQYFPSKEVLVQAMAVRGRELVLEELERCLAEIENNPQVQETEPRDFIRPILRILIQGFAGGRSWTRSLVRLAWTQEEPQETASAVRQVSDRLALLFERIRHPRMRVLGSAQLFVLTRSVIGTLRSASLEKSPLLQSPALEDALVEMVWALIGQAPAAAPAP